MNSESRPFPALLGQVCQSIKRLYRGAASEVWLARQRSMDRLVAVKVLREDCHDPAQIGQMIHEARVLARISHPGVVGLFDSGLEEGRPWLILEYMEGPTLAEWMRQSPHPPLQEALYVAGAMLKSLEGVHEIHLVHRDVKPANFIEFVPGVFRILDFGLAIEQGSASGQAAAPLEGTPCYMSPEQCEGRPAASPSDLYSAAVVIHEMLSGQPPFPGPATGDYIHQHRHIPPIPLRQLRDDVPAALEDLVIRALSKEPSGRPASSTRMRLDLEDIRRSLP